MTHFFSTLHALGASARWASASLRGQAADFYRRDPEGYEAVARVLMGREEVAASVRNIVDIGSRCKDRGLAVDAACGTGLVTHALAGSAQNVRGIDLCEKALAFAKESKHSSLEFSNGDLHDFSSFEPGSIDVYSMAFAHRYIQDRGQFYQDLARSLADDGQAVISTVGYRSSLEKIQDAADGAGLVMRVIQPRFRSLFNRMHGTAHAVLKHASTKQRVSVPENVSTKTKFSI